MLSCLYSASLSLTIHLPFIATHGALCKRLKNVKITFPYVHTVYTLYATYVIYMYVEAATNGSYLFLMVFGLKRRSHTLERPKKWDVFYLVTSLEYCVSNRSQMQCNTTGSY